MRGKKDVTTRSAHKTKDMVLHFPYRPEVREGHLLAQEKGAAGFLEARLEEHQGALQRPAVQKTTHVAFTDERAGFSMPAEKVQPASSTNESA